MSLKCDESTHQPGTTCYLCHQYIPEQGAELLQPVQLKPAGAYPYVSVGGRGRDVHVEMSIDTYADLLEMLSWYKKEIKKEGGK